MSEYTDTYRARQDIRWRMRKVKKNDESGEYWKLKGEEEKLGLKLNEIIKREKDVARLHAEIPLERRG